MAASARHFDGGGSRSPALPNNDHRKPPRGGGDHDADPGEAGVTRRPDHAASDKRACSESEQISRSRGRSPTSVAVERRGQTKRYGIEK